MNAIHIDIIGKTHPAGWRIIGVCPATVTESEGLHVYAGPHARVLDSETDQVIACGRSLLDVLQNLADSTGLPVELTDERTQATRTFLPGGAR